MKRPNPNLTTNKPYISYSAARLFEDDLERIIMFAVERELEIEISDAEYQYDTLEDVRENRGTNVFDITLVFRDKEEYLDRVSIEISRKGISLFGGTSDKLVALYYEIDRVVKRRVPFYSVLLRPTDYAIGGILLLLMLSKILESSEKDLNFFTVPFALFFFALISYAEKRRLTGVTLRRKHEAGNFIERYKNQIVLLLIGSAITIATQYALKYLGLD